MKFNYIPLILLMNMSSFSVSIAADNPEVNINFNGDAVRYYCVYDNRLYSEGAVYKTSDGKRFICMSLVKSGNDKANLVWRKTNGDGGSE